MFPHFNSNISDVFEYISHFSCIIPSYDTVLIVGLDPAIQKIIIGYRVIGIFIYIRTQFLIATMRQALVKWF